MSEDKSRFNPWVPTIILGVVAVLFSFYALQSQTDLQDARKEILQLENQVTTCARELDARQQSALEMSAGCEQARLQVEEDLRECQKQAFKGRTSK